jgi:ATP-dependent DNA ligase
LKLATFNARAETVTEKPFYRTAFKHACALGCEGIVSKRLGSSYRSGRSEHWIKVKNRSAPAVKREAEEEWR